MQHAPTVLPRPEPHRKRVGAPGHTVGGDSAEGVRAGEGVPAPCPERRLLGEQKSPEDTAQRSGLHAAATGGRDQWEGGNDAVLSGVTGTVPYRPHTSGSRGPYNSEGRGEQKSAENERRRKRREDERRHAKIGALDAAQLEIKLTIFIAGPPGLVEFSRRTCRCFGG